jgi:pSer/pThr/pTyr-binding forkhead associated (FHA) protein
MFNLKFLMRCCCDHQGQNEEEKQEKARSSKRDKPSLKPSSQIQKTKLDQLPKEDPIIPAPSPVIIQETQSFPKLKLRIVESSVIPVGTLLTINGFGLENSRRNKQDFKVFIGNILEDKGEVINDFMIAEESLGMGKQHLLIKFAQTTNKYTITDLGDGTGTFVKISTDLVLKEGFIISFGNSHMKVEAVSPKLILKFLEGPKINEEFIFTPQDEQIIIGRMNDCRIRFEDTNLSRYQCNIKFQEERGWALKDGVGNKNSTNGTWIYVEEEFEITDKMMFKAGKTLFEATLGD